MSPVGEGGPHLVQRMGWGEDVEGRLDAREEDRVQMDQILRLLRERERERDKVSEG